MLHPIDYRLSKNKFWVSTWNSYSLKNYQNLILNDKLLGVLGQIFRDCFKITYIYSAPWNNIRKKKIKHQIIGFDGRRIIKKGLNNMKKLPSFLISEDYYIIRFNNFVILKVFFLIDKNKDIYWFKKEKKRKSPLNYLDLNYLSGRNKNISDQNIKKVYKNKKLLNHFKLNTKLIYIHFLLNKFFIKNNIFSLKKKKNDMKLNLYYYNNINLLTKVRNKYYLFYSKFFYLNKLFLNSIKNKIKYYNYNNNKYLKNINYITYLNKNKTSINNSFLFKNKKINNYKNLKFINNNILNFIKTKNFYKNFLFLSLFLNLKKKKKIENKNISVFKKYLDLKQSKITLKNKKKVNLLKKNKFLFINNFELKNSNNSYFFNKFIISTKLKNQLGIFNKNKQKNSFLNFYLRKKYIPKNKRFKKIKKFSFNFYNNNNLNYLNYEMVKTIKLKTNYIYNNFFKFIFKIKNGLSKNNLNNINYNNINYYNVNNLYLHNYKNKIFFYKKKKKIFFYTYISSNFIEKDKTLYLNKNFFTFNKKLIKTRLFNQKKNINNVINYKKGLLKWKIYSYKSLWYFYPLNILNITKKEFINKRLKNLKIRINLKKNQKQKISYKKKKVEFFFKSYFKYYNIKSFSNIIFKNLFNYSIKKYKNYILLNKYKIKNLKTSNIVIYKNINILLNNYLKLKNINNNYKSMANKNIKLIFFNNLIYNKSIFLSQNKIYKKDKLYLDIFKKSNNIVKNNFNVINIYSKLLKNKNNNFFYLKKKVLYNNLNRVLKINKLYFINNNNLNYKIKKNITNIISYSYKFVLKQKKTNIKFLNFIKNNNFKINNFILKKKNNNYYWDNIKFFNIYLNNNNNYKFIKNNNVFYSIKRYEIFRLINLKIYKNYLKNNFLNTYKKDNIFYKNYKDLNKFLTLNSFFQKSKKVKFNVWNSRLYYNLSKKRLNYANHKLFLLKKIQKQWRVIIKKISLLGRFFRSKSKFYFNKFYAIKDKKMKKKISLYLTIMKKNYKYNKMKLQKELPFNVIKWHILKNLKILIKRLKSNKNKKRFFKTQLINRFNKFFKIKKVNIIQLIKGFIEHIFFILFKINNLRIFYFKKYKINIMSRRSNLFKYLFNFRLATGFKIPFLIKTICKKFSYDKKKIIGCKIGFFGRYTKKLRNRKIWRYVRYIKPSSINTSLDYYNLLVLQKWGITGLKITILRKKFIKLIY